MGEKMGIFRNAKSITLSLIIFGATASVASADIITFPSNQAETSLDASQIVAAGSGCPQGTVNISSINSKVAVISHLELAGSIEDGNLIRKTCKVRVPVKGESGFQVALQATSSGRIELGDQDTISINRELFVAGSSGEVQTIAYQGELSRRLKVTELAESKLSFSACGADSILAMNLSAMLRAHGQSLIASHFNLNKTVIKLIVRKCN